MHTNDLNYTSLILYYMYHSSQYHLHYLHGTFISSKVERRKFIDSLSWFTDGNYIGGFQLRVDNVGIPAEITSVDFTKFSSLLELTGVARTRCGLTYDQALLVVLF
jgi:hypothetical protein